MTALRRSESAGLIDGLPVVRIGDAGLPVALNHIDGRWRPGSSGSWLRVSSPSSGAVIGLASLSTVADIGVAVDAARKAQRDLAALASSRRADLCRQIAESILRDADGLARLLSIEQGKPLVEAGSEVLAAASGFRAAAEQLASTGADDFLRRDRERITLSRRRARGVFGLVAAANFPLGMPSVACLGPAVATGNAVVWLPAATTSRVSAALLECMLAGGLPPGVVSLVIGDQADLAPALAQHPGVAGLSHLGGRAPRRALGRVAADVPVRFDDSGTSVSVVLPDADIEAATDAIARRGYDNAGQIGTHGARVLVHASIQSRLVEALAAAALERRHGDILDPATTLGPVNNAHALVLLERQIADARRRGGRFAAGGTRVQSETGLHVAAGVVTGLDLGCLFNREESQGPVIPVFGFRSGVELGELARAGPLGHSIAVFTRSVDAADDAAQSVGADTVTVNEARTCLDDGCNAGRDDRGVRGAILAMTTRVTLSVPAKALPSRDPSTSQRPERGLDIRGGRRPEFSGPGAA